MTDRELMQQALEALEEPREHIFRHRRLEAITALRERLAQPEQKPFFTEANGFPQTFVLKPEQSPLDRMAENARELGLDYEPPMEDLRVQQSAWDNIPQEFNDWWNEDYDDSTNPFKLNSSAYWAWAGWQARRKKLAQPEQEPPRFPTMLRKMWSGGEVQKWIDENWSKHGFR